MLDLNGRDLKPLPLEDRKAQLAKLFGKVDAGLLGVVPHFDDGEALMLACMEKDVEGIVSKRRDAPYRSGPRPEWVKVKSPIWRQSNLDRWKVLSAR